MRKLKGCDASWYLPLYLSSQLIPEHLPAADTTRGLGLDFGAVMSIFLASSLCT
ncbi:MAG: hypothetical protein QXG17_01185 [Sulfolobales archaeon]